MIGLSKYGFILICITLLFSCKSTEEFGYTKYDLKQNFLYEDIPDTTFIALQKYDANFLYDLKYATEDNFTKQKIYDCATCLLRKKVADCLIKANKAAKQQGYYIKIFDCYRPLDVQKKMWELVPNPDYVANPKNGSVHNRGCAVDITLTDINKNNIDMGTSFDYFGIEASHNYTKLDSTIIKNRKTLKSIMQEANFLPLNSEWWHYNLNEGTKEKISNFKWNCEP